MTTTTQTAVSRHAMQIARDVLGLFKLRIGLLIMLTALVGLAITPGPTPGATQVFALALAVLVASASAGAFNQYFEYETDRLMARTRGRAFVTGALPRTPAWLVLIGALLIASVALAALVLNLACALFVFLGAFFYAVVYTVWLKGRSWLNVVVGGLAGSFAVLAGAAAVDPTPHPIAWLFALVLFLWTPPHFWSLAIANRDDYVAARIPMLPVVIGSERAARVVFGSTIALAAVSLMPIFFGAGPAYLIGAVGGGLYFVGRAGALARAPSRERAMRSFHASLIQLSALLVGATLDVSMRWLVTRAVLALVFFAFGTAHAGSTPPLDQRAAVEASQSVIGSTPADYRMLDSEGRLVHMSNYRGKPLLVSFIYTGCFRICPTSTVALHQAIAAMRDQFGTDQFAIVSIGFNQPADTPAALDAFAAQHRIADANWKLLSPRREDVPALARDFGFSYVATPAGFDHTLQVTILDAHGVIRRQVYGDQFTAAALGEPLKQLLAGGSVLVGLSLSEIFDRVRILCSVYDPALGKYRTDYTLPLQIAGGLTFIVAMLWFAAAEWRSRRALRRSLHSRE
jgi:protoheme IX farnesyltransferase